MRFTSHMRLWRLGIEARRRLFEWGDPVGARALAERAPCGLQFRAAQFAPFLDHGKGASRELASQ